MKVNRAPGRITAAEAFPVTDVQYYMVFRCRMRGQWVQVEFEDQQAEPALILDMATGRQLFWILTKEERAALEAVLTAP